MLRWMFTGALSLLCACDLVGPWCDTPPEDHVAVYVWNSDATGDDAPMLAPDGFITWTLGADATVPPMAARATLVLPGGGDPSLRAMEVDCDDGATLRTFPVESVVAGQRMDFPADCGEGPTCALSICLRFENHGDAARAVDALVNVWLVETLACGEEARDADEAPVHFLDEIDVVTGAL